MERTDLDSYHQDARYVYEYLKGKEGKFEGEALSRVKGLLQDGRRQIVRGDPDATRRICLAVKPLFKSLGRLSEATFDSPLAVPVVRTLRIFAELRTAKMKEEDEDFPNAGGYLQQVGKILNALHPKKNVEHVGLAFELRCFEQALLHRDAEDKLIDLAVVARFLEAAESLVEGKLSSALALVAELKERPTKKGWYKYALFITWDSLCTNDMDGYLSKLRAFEGEVIQKSAKYLGVAMVNGYRNIVMSDRSDEDRWKAFAGLCRLSARRTEYPNCWAYRWASKTLNQLCLESVPGGVFQTYGTWALRQSLERGDGEHFAEIASWAPIDTIDEKGRSLLHYVRTSYGLSCLETAGFDGHIDLQDSEGNAPLHLAAGCPDVLRWLLHREAVVDIKNKEGYEPIHYAVEHTRESVEVLLEYGANRSVVDAQDRTLLHHAAWSAYPNANVISFLLEEGLDPNAKDDQGSSPLHFVVMHAEGQAAVELARLLIDAGAELDWNTPKGRSLLHEAIAHHHTGHDLRPLVRYFVEQGLSPFKATGNFWSGLWCAPLELVVHENREYAAGLIPALLDPAERDGLFEQGIRQAILRLFWTDAEELRALLEPYLD